MSKISNIITFPRHKFEKCGCGESSCHICSGGLAHCTTCGGFEGALTEDCPQREMTNEEFEAVYREEIDFRNKLGGWTTWTRAKEMAVRRQLS